VPAIAQVEPLTTARALRGPFDYQLPEDLRARVAVGSMLVVPFGRRELVGVVVGLVDESSVAPERLVAPLRALEQGVPPELVSLAAWIAAEYCSTPARALALVLPPRAVRRRRPVHEPLGALRGSPPPLSADQARALDALAGPLRAGEHARFLLHGVTGSGKTEVYLRAVERTLASGRSAIVLVPEISLTPQVVSRVTERFGDTVAVLHSRLSAGERHDEWMRLRAGEARVCVGPRSAVFAPLERLGLIVIDEEHDASYKHEGDPRYDARRVAERRARLAGAVLVAGSATPRPESIVALPRLSLPARIDGQVLPPVRILDMRGAERALHPETTQALAAVRAQGGKAIVLLNRRGWSNFLTCRSCGRAWGCPSCDVTLVLHRADGALACHHCGHRQPAPGRCPDCASVSVARHGMGTERLERELSAALGDDRFPIFRLDADVAARAGRGAGVLRAFERAETGLLVGTQMVAKGHDFPDVTLGVVLDADATLRFPDFRAEERTFALIAQLAGRAGRRRSGQGSAGRVLVQTLVPEASSIRYAARHDSEGFLAGELERRRALRYPPFSDLIRIVCLASDARAAQLAAAEIAERVRIPGAAVLGPAPLFRLRGRERSQVVVKATDRAAAIAAVGAAVETVAGDRRHRPVSFSVDVDPQ
jgi:primosomal protein N' (replication factor Y)